MVWKCQILPTKKGIADVCSENLLESILLFEQGLEKTEIWNPIKKHFSGIMDNVM